MRWSRLEIHMSVGSLRRSARFPRSVRSLALGSVVHETAQGADQLVAFPTRQERKPVQSLQVVEAWRALVGIVDGFLVAYDIYTRMPLAQIAESKGCTIYALHAPSRQVGKPQISVITSMYSKRQVRT